MNKKILAAAIAASIAAPMAVAADVTVFGKLHSSADAVDRTTASGATVATDNWQQTSRASRIGFKGTEDLGNGLKANFSMEFQYNIDGNATSPVAFAQRNTWIGLSGDFGEFRMGRHDTPAKVALYAGGIDMLGDSIADVNRDMNFASLVNGNTTGTTNTTFNLLEETRASNAFAYISPNMSGFQMAAAIVPGEAAGNAAGAATDLADSYSLGAWYGNGGLKVSASYEQFDDNSAAAASDDMSIWGVYGSYSMGDFAINAAYQDVDGYRFARNHSKDTWLVGASFTMGNNKLMANYGQGESDVAGVQANDADTWSIAAQHSFSKRTAAYVAYTDSENELTTAANDDVDADVFSMGLMHSF